MKTLFPVIILTVANVAHAGGTGPGSLIPAGVNVLILIVAIVFFLRKPASDFFSSKSSSVSEMLDRASAKAKEAEMMMQAQKKKTEGVEAEIKKLESENAELIKSFEAEYSREVTERIAKLKEDASQKIEAEKKELMNGLNSNLLDLVIDKAKNQIKADKALASNAAKKIVEGL